MTIDQLLEAVLDEVSFTEAETKALEALSNSGAYTTLTHAMSRMVLACGQQALDDHTRVQYWDGFRNGLLMMFSLTDTAAEEARALLADAEYKEKHNELEEEEEEVDISMAISSLGSSPL